MRTCDRQEITIEKLMNVVHNFTDPIRIMVVMNHAACANFPEARRMHDFILTACYSYRDGKEQERLLKYYKDVPVWNLTVWQDGPYSSGTGRTYCYGIEARCYYEDIREGWLAEKADKTKERRKERRKEKKARNG